jgi:hypothetical protein
MRRRTTDIARPIVLSPLGADELPSARPDRACRKRGIAAAPVAPGERDVYLITHMVGGALEARRLAVGMD